MNRTELAEAVAEKTGLDRKNSEAAVEAVTEAIVSEIKAGNRVSIFGFGSFEPRARAARIARNPQTQETVKVAASKSVAFKPAAKFKETLNAKGRAGAAKKGAASKATAKSAATKATAKSAAAAKTTSTRTAAKKTAPTKAPAAKAAPAKATRATKKR